MSYRLTYDETLSIIQNIRNAIKHYFLENQLTDAIFGKSEGLDSLVIAGLLSKIEGIKPIGVIIACESDLETERIAKVVFDHFRIPWIMIDLKEGNFTF